MLQIVAGRSGSGKSEEIWRRLEATLTGENAPNLCVLLVPEQFSSETEHALLTRLGPTLTQRVRVFSFTHMADTVRREVGGRGGLGMAEGTRVVLLAKAMRELVDRLQVYHMRKTDASRLASMLTLLEELHGCAVTAEQLNELADRLEDGALGRKLRDLALIDDGYQALVAQSYLDPMDSLLHLVEDLPKSQMLAGCTVFVDGFKSFTGQEMQVLETLMTVATAMTVTLGYDPYGAQNDELDLFAEILKTAAALENTARRHGVPVKTACRLTENHRHREVPALAVLEERLFRAGSPSEDIPPQGVELMKCGNIYDECRLAVRRLHRYLREGGRCRNVALVVRNLSSYRGILEPMLERAGIPYFMDCRESVRTDPLIVTVIEALQCVTGNWQTEALFKLMKTGLLGFAPRTVALLENYVYMWNIRGAAWKREWTANPDGLTAPVTEKTQQTLRYLNMLRRRLVMPLLALQKRLTNGCNGRGFAEAVYDYLQKARVRRLVVLRVRRLKADGDRDLADRAARTWDVLMGLLDQFAAAAGEEQQRGEDFLALFTLAADLTDIGSIPSGLDVVQIGQADRIRYSEPELVLILGANAGVFPASPQRSGLLGDAERTRLVENGLPLTDTSAHRMMEERYFAYSAVSAATRELYVSYQSEDEDGKPIDPSLLVEEIRRLLPQIELQRDDPAAAETPEELFHYLGRHWKTGSPLASSLHVACAESPETAERYRRMRGAADDRSLHFESPAEAKRLFKKLSSLSPTAVETYYECPFGYFCRYGLRLKERNKAELNALEFGSAAHYVMETCIPVYAKQGFATLRKAGVMQDAAEALRRYVEERMGGTADKPDRFLYLLSRLERLCGYFLWHVVRELRQSRFVPTDFELRIGDEVEGEPSTPPLTVTLPDGSTIRVIGTIDRVDVYKVGDVSYVRVVDYKTGQKAFRLDDVVNGINLQMLIYLSALWENGGPRYGTVIPAGMLYLPSKLPVVKAGEGAKQEAAQTKTMTMNGLVLNNPEIVQAMEADGGGLFIPVQLKKGGDIHSRSVNSIATLAEFGMLKKRAENLLRRMAETLHSGGIDPCPTISKTVDACQYCKYKAICGHEPEDPNRTILPAKNVEILAELKEAEQQEQQEEDIGCLP